MLSGCNSNDENEQKGSMPLLSFFIVSPAPFTAVLERKESSTAECISYPFPTPHNRFTFEHVGIKVHFQFTSEYTKVMCVALEFSPLDKVGEALLF